MFFRNREQGGCPVCARRGSVPGLQAKEALLPSIQLSRRSLAACLATRPPARRWVRGLREGARLSGCDAGCP